MRLPCDDGSRRRHREGRRRASRCHAPGRFGQHPRGSRRSRVGPLSHARARGSHESGTRAPRSTRRPPPTGRSACGTTLRCPDGAGATARKSNASPLTSWRRWSESGSNL
jgi:hypothetical protein